MSLLYGYSEINKKGITHRDINHNNIYIEQKEGEY